MDYIIQVIFKPLSHFVYRSGCPTETISLLPLIAAGGLFIALIALNLSGVRKTAPYLFIAVLLWYALLQSGVHATLAGILGALTVPAFPRYDPSSFSVHVKKLMHSFDASHKPGQSIMTNEKLRSVVQTLENGVRSVEAPLQRMERAWHMPVAYLIIPVFALANAGIPVAIDSLGTTIAHPVMLGVSVGLMLGKFIGITGVSWVLLKLGVATLPKNTRFTQIAGVSLLAGIGFTMSIFVAELGFAHQPELLLMAKTGILMTSFVSGVAGFIWLYLVSEKKA